MTLCRGDHKDGDDPNHICCVNEFLRELNKRSNVYSQKMSTQWHPMDGGGYLDYFPNPSSLPIIYPLLVGNEASTRKNLLLRRKSLINATGVLSGRALLSLAKELTF